MGLNEKYFYLRISLNIHDTRNSRILFLEFILLYISEFSPKTNKIIIRKNILGSKI